LGYLRNPGRLLIDLRESFGIAFPLEKFSSIESYADQRQGLSSILPSQSSPLLAVPDQQ
jgi:hypothetical protein